jgi:adenine-specific DNA-methyltransferase
MLKTFYEYEQQVDSSKRTQLGIIYTPISIVEYINTKVLELWTSEVPPKVIDPCCGTGIFLYDMAKRIADRWALPIEDVYEKYIYGCDLDEEAIKIGRRLIPDANLKVADSLIADFTEYDIIVTNPPYVRIQNLDEETRLNIKKKFSFCMGDTDIYIAFFQKLLETKKLTGFICPNSWIKNKFVSRLRHALKEERRAETIIDFRSKKVFKSVGTYTSIVILDSKEVKTVKVGHQLNQETEIKQSELFLGEVLLINQENRDFVAEVLGRKTGIFDVCDINVGLATLADDVFCLELVEVNFEVCTVRKRKKESESFNIETACLRPCVRAGDITKNNDKAYVMIYPYTEEGENLSKREIKQNFPMAYRFIRANKERLLARDKGKCREKGYKWYQYGRKQGINLTKKEKLLFASMTKDKMSMQYCSQGVTFVSGYCIIPKPGFTLEEVNNIFSSDEVGNWISIFGKNFGTEWVGVSKETFKHFKAREKEMSKRILIIDALNMMYRNYIVDPSISTNGAPIGGLKGFMKSLQKLVRETKPDDIIVCWDGEGGSQRRRAQNKDYKEGRKPIRLNRSTRNLSEDEEKENKFWQQLRLIEYLNQLPITQLMLPSVEADDVIGYVTQYSKFKEHQKVIVSSDKDFFQLCNGNTILYRPIQKTILNESRVTEEYGIHPNNFALARAICGDKSDNIKGIQGAGLPTIAKRFPFMKNDSFCTIETVIDHCEEQEKKLLIHERILDNRDKISDNYKLMQLYAPSISAQGTHQLRAKLDNESRIFNKTAIISMMFEDGVGEYNWLELWTCFNKIVWESKAPF